MKRYLPFALLLILCLLALTACGGTGEEDAQEDTPPEAQADQQPEAETQSEPEAQPEEEPDAEGPEEEAEIEVELQSMPDTADVDIEILPEAHIVGDAVSVGELAYDSRGGGEYSVYLPEKQRYVPFLVLTGDYGGNALLLRRDILPGARAFNNYSAFYEDSEIDRWLNGEYAAWLTDIQSLLRPSEIAITEEESLGASGNSTKTITRTIFLLSCAETGFLNLTNTGTEGGALSFFQTVENRTARKEDGSAASWWLRTPDAYYLSAAYGIGPDGTLGSGNAYNENGVRPALCVPPDAQAVPADNIADGQSVYILLA